MLLTITTTHVPATDLGYLLHKNPARVQSFPLTFGQAHVFYPEATADRCMMALLLELDPVGLVRHRRGASGREAGLDTYVNDRPYVASSFLSVAIAEVFGSALKGRSRERPDLAERPLPLSATLASLPCHGGETLLRRLFEPLGYDVRAMSHALEPSFPEWGASPYFTVELDATTRLRDLLAHLYVLVPVLDDRKHYWVGDDEIEKLLRSGEGWLAHHPAREVITSRYLKHYRRLTSAALARLTQEEGGADDAPERAEAEESAERPLRLNEERMVAVAEALRASGAKRVLDLGCGEGQLIARLLKVGQFTEIAGVDLSHQALERAGERLRLAQLPPAQRERVRLLQGSLLYRDARLIGYDAAALVEVIEHLEPGRLDAFERVLFEVARPTTIVITTPNANYNPLFPSLPAGAFRHPDHRFEWGRDEFQRWAASVAEQHGYSVRFQGIGQEAVDYGPPTQMAIFTHEDNKRAPEEREAR
jgi:3' terminal RNA ribose 2'-O-methyltransferase Hen1